MKWNVTRLIAAGSLGVVYLILSLSGGIFQTFVGIPGAAGFIMGFLGALLLAFCCLSINQFGAATLMTFVYGVLAIPLPVLGTPGFFPKIAMAVLAGLAADSVYHLLRKNEKVAAMIVGAVAESVITGLFFGLGLLFNMPGIEKALKFALSGSIVIFVLGLFGGYIGYLIFDRLRNTGVVRRIRRK